MVGRWAARIWGIRLSGCWGGFQVHDDEAGYDDGYAGAGGPGDGFVGEVAPEEAPDGEEIGHCDDVGCGDVG